MSFGLQKCLLSEAKVPHDRLFKQGCMIKYPATPSEVKQFDQMRRKRHRVIYEVAGLVSKNEAEQAVHFSKEFVSQIAALIA